jgi:hypothetical protein
VSIFPAGPPPSLFDDSESRTPESATPESPEPEWPLPEEDPDVVPEDPEVPAAPELLEPDDVGVPLEDPDVEVPEPVEPDTDPLLDDEPVPEDPPSSPTASEPVELLLPHPAATTQAAAHDTTIDKDRSFMRVPRKCVYEIVVDAVSWSSTRWNHHRRPCR